MTAHSTIDAIQMVLRTFKGEIMSTDIAKDRIDTAIRNIFSGNNNCCSLGKAVESGRGEYFYNCIAPIVAVYEAEADQLRKDRDNALKDAENKRYALEMIASNIWGHNLVETCKGAIERGLPGRQL